MRIPSKKRENSLFQVTNLHIIQPKIKKKNMFQESRWIYLKMSDIAHPIIRKIHA